MPATTYKAFPSAAQVKSRRSFQPLTTIFCMDLHYRGLQKNATQLFAICALVNVYLGLARTGWRTQTSVNPAYLRRT